MPVAPNLLEQNFTAQKPNEKWANDGRPRGVIVHSDLGVQYCANIYQKIHGEKFKTREEAKNHIFDYIEIYYNKVRLHSKLGYCSPEVFEVEKVA